MTAIQTEIQTQKHYGGFHRAGFRPIQIWVPDTQRPGFMEECHRQSYLVSQADMADKELLDFMDEMLVDIDSLVKP